MLELRILIEAFYNNIVNSNNYTCKRFKIQKFFQTLVIFLELSQTTFIQLNIINNKKDNITKLKDFMIKN